MFAALLPILSSLFGNVIDRILPNPEDELKREQMKNALQLAIIQRAADIENAAADIVKQEAGSSHWLTATWRPIVMLTFTSLIVARWLGFSAPGISENEVSQLWDIVHIGLGGYIIGRSAEKVAPHIASAINAKGKG